MSDTPIAVANTAAASFSAESSAQTADVTRSEESSLSTAGVSISVGLTEI